jgi:outer membrane lipoprotein SlyB
VTRRPRAPRSPRVSGTAGAIELDNENGNVVYSVEITKADGSKLDVKVDAGNARVLHQEADDGDDAGEAEEREADEGTEAEEPGR